MLLPKVSVPPLHATSAGGRSSLCHIPLFGQIITPNSDLDIRNFTRPRVKLSAIGQNLDSAGDHRPVSTYKRARTVAKTKHRPAFGISRDRS